MENSVVIAVAIACCCFLYVFGRFFYLISKISGPSLWEVLTVHAKPLLDDDMITYICKLCALYDYKPWGMWMMKLEYVVFVSDCETISAVYKSKSMTDKPDFLYDQISQFIGKGLLTMNGPNYPRQRKVINVGLRKSLQDNFLRRMPTLMSDFVKALRQKSAGGSQVDLRRLVTWHVMASMISSFTSVSYDVADLMQACLDNMPRGMELIQMQAVNPVYYWLFEHFKSSTKRNIAETLAYLATLDDILVKEKSRCISSTLKESESSQGIAQAIAKSYINSELDDSDNEVTCAIGRIFFIASFETTSFVINTVSLLLALHQDVQQRVYDELDLISEKEGPILSGDIDRLEYLEMVIKESLRLFPAAPLLARSVREDTNVNGVTLPNGSIVAISVMALHRNPEYFPDPLKFDPDRFSSEMSSGRRPYTYIPFSAGVRSCPGTLHAFLMMKLVLYHVVKNFRLFPGDKLHSLDDIKVKMCFTLHLEESSLRLENRGSGKTYKDIS